MKVNTSKWLQLLPLGMGSFISSISPPTSNEYKSLKKPFIQPPGWVFAPVWTTLYLLIGKALYRLKQNDSQKAFRLLLIQLVLNYSWPVVFFRWNKIKLASLILNVMVAQQFFTLYETFKVDTKAGLVMIPYTAWITFAKELNRQIVELNHE